MYFTEDEINNIYIIIGENIQRARNKVNIKQDELASKVQLGRTSITNIEKGKQKILIHTLYQIAFALGVPIQDLLPNKDTSTPDINQLLSSQSLDQETTEAVLRVIGSKNVKPGRPDHD